MVENTSLPASIMSRMAVLGVSSGIFLVIATLIAVALLAPRSAGAAVAEGYPAACPLAEISLDQGYGVSRTAIRPVCAPRDAYGLAQNSAAK